jgi:hypothetical protein
MKMKRLPRSRLSIVGRIHDPPAFDIQMCILRRFTTMKDDILRFTIIKFNI